MGNPGGQDLSSDDTRRWRRSPGVAVVGDGERVVAIDLDGLTPDSVPVIMEGTAAAIWNAIGEGSTVGELAERLAVEFGAEPSGIVGDIRKFVADLHQQGLLTQE